MISIVMGGFITFKYFTDNKQDTEQTSEVEYPKEYEEIISSFLTAITSEKRMQAFVRSEIDYNGLIVWQNTNNSVEKYPFKYKAVKITKETKNDIQDYLIDLADEYSMENFEVKLSKIVGFEELDECEDLSLVTAKVKSRANENASWEIEEVVFVFDKQKLLDIQISTEDTFKSIFAEFDIDIREHLADGYSLYKIKEGDTIESLAKEFDIEQTDIVNLNYFTNIYNILMPGDKIVIPIASPT